MQRRSLILSLVLITALGVALALLLRHQAPSGRGVGSPTTGDAPSSDEPARALLTSVRSGLREGTLQPDPFSDDILRVLASLPEDMRWMVDMPHAPTRLLMARSRALTSSNMTGDPKEIEPFIEYLEAPPPPRNPMFGELGGPISLEAKYDEFARSAATWALLKAAVAEVNYGRSTYQRIAAAAREHALFEHDLMVRLQSAAILHFLHQTDRIEPRPEDERLIEHAVQSSVDAPRHWSYFTTEFEEEFRKGEAY